MRYAIWSMLLLLVGPSAILAATPKVKCIDFDLVALQLAIAQKNMSSPLNLEQIQLLLGPGKPIANSDAIEYSWPYKENRVLLITVTGNNITHKILTGKDDGSDFSRKMENIFAKLKSATSVWSIQEIQQQLGPGTAMGKKLPSYCWECGVGSLLVTTNDSGKVTSANITYNAPKNTIEARVGPNHPEWDEVKDDSLGASSRAWKRSFGS